MNNVCEQLDVCREQIAHLNMAQSALLKLAHVESRLNGPSDFIEEMDRALDRIMIRKSRLEFLERELDEKLQLTSPSVGPKILP